MAFRFRIKSNLGILLFVSINAESLTIMTFAIDKNKGENVKRGSLMASILGKLRQA